MEDDLKFWKLKEWLDIHEASSLALGCDPSNSDVKPDGWEGFFSALKEAVDLDIEEDRKKLSEVTTAKADKKSEVSICKLIFTSHTVKGYGLGYLCNGQVFL